MSRKSQRVVLKSQAREIISKVYDFMKTEASKNYAEKLTDARWRTAQAAGVSESTVTRILRERKKCSNKQTTVPAKESNISTETDAIVPSAEYTTEPTIEADIESEDENEARTLNLVGRNPSILTSPMKKRMTAVESTLTRFKRPCKKVLPAVAFATQTIQTNTNSIQEVNPDRSNIMPMNFDVKVKVENVVKNAIEKQHEIISWREILKKSTEIYLQSNNICDKILHIQVLNTCKPDVQVFVKTPHEKLLDRAFTRWCDWASLTEEPKDPPLFYKCYICDMAWWHLAHFRDHIRTHEPSSLRVVLEMNDFVECNIVAYYTKSANKYIANIEGKCWKCGEKASEHTKLKNCVGCKRRFYTCSKLRQHQWYCEEFKKVHLDLFASAEKIFKCHLCRFYYFKKEDSIEHMILRHSVRSDVPIPGCSVCEKCKDLISYEDDHVCESKGYVKTCDACKKRVTESSAAVHQIEGNFTCSVCKLKIVNTCSIHLHALSHTMNYGLAYKCLTCKFFIIFDLEQIKNHKMFYHSNRDFDYDLISVPKTILDRLKSTPDKHGSPVDSQINTFLLSHDPQDTVNDRDDDDVIIIDNVPKVIVIPSDDASNDDLPCVIANIKSEPLENEIQTSETKHNVTLQNDFECKTMVIEIPKDTKDIFKRLSGENRINDDKALGINEIKRTNNVNTVDHIKKLKPITKQTLLTDVSRNLESDVKIEVINSVDVVEEEKLMTVGLSGIQLNKEKREKARPVDTFKNLEQITPKQSEVSGRIKVEKLEDEIDIPWHTVPIKEEADPEMDFKLSNIRSCRRFVVVEDVGENEIDVKQEINKFDLSGQSKYWFSFANNSHLITISPNVTLNTDDDGDDERNRSHRKMGKLNKAPKTSAERGREFRARKALLKQLCKQKQEPGPLGKKQVPSEITTIEKRAKSAEATRRWREKKRGVSESSKKQAKTAAQRMREYRKRKKM